MTTINTHSTSTAGAVSGASSSSATGTIPSASDINTEFLTLFTTQLKNQDPLNPMDSSQMTSQLAQISTVSGIQNLNDTMKAMMSSNTAVQASQSAGLIGKTVMGPGSSFALGASGSAQVGVTLPSSAESVTINIKNAAGQTIRSYTQANQNAGSASLTWDGKDSSGNPLPPGNYSISASAIASGKSITPTTLVQGVVTGVTSNSSGVSLNVQGVGNIPVASLTQIN
jgi:flagellar basal-body rod modification protein FlgD